MKDTILDIAQQLNVSTSTVSRSLRQDPSIHPRTRAKVAEVAIRLGYEGRTQRGSRTVQSKRSLGVLMASGDSERPAVHENFVRMLQGISEECDRLDLPLMLHTSPHSKAGKMARQPELVPVSLRDHSIDAMLLIGPLHHNDVAFIAEQIPAITLSWIFKGIDTDAVLVDNVEGIAAMVTKLTDLGHRRLAWVPQLNEASFFTARHSGFLQGCLAGGLKLEEQRVVQPSPALADKPFHDIDLRALVESGVSGFVCTNDGIAKFLLLELAEQNISVPHEVSVTGFDAVSNTSPHDLVLDSIDPHFADVGRDAVRLAMRRIQNPTARTAFLTVRSSIIEGQTIAPPRC
jgi:DNA-binding LacI/PurR family transcriptional regulator